MRTTSDTWKQYIKDDDWTFIASLKVGDTEYTEITTPTITRNAIPTAMTCGSCVSATLSVSVYTDDTFDPTVPIVVLGKLAQAGTVGGVVGEDVVGEFQIAYEGYNYSEQLEFGTFYIDTQTKTSDGYVELSCYDAMLKANATYMDADSISSGFPKDMADAVEEIAELIGVEVDDRTELLTGDDYLIQFETGVTAQTVLEQIANCNGGNWIITEDNKLRLIKIGTDFSALESGGDYVIASAVLGSLSLFAGESNDTTYGEGYTFKGVSDSTGDNTTGESPYLYINNVEDFTDDMYTNLYNDRLNKMYYPFTATSVVLDPAFETGDDIYIPNDASFDIENLESDTDIENYSYICSQALSVTLTLNYSFRATISVDSVGDLESEYPYIGKYDELSSTVSSVSDTVDSVSSSVSDLSDTVDSVSSSVDSVTSTVSDLSDTVDSVSSSVGDLSDTVDTVSDSVDTLSDTVDTVSSDVSDLSDTVDTVSDSVDTLSDTVDTVSDSVDTLSDDVDDLSDDVDDLTDTVSDLSDSISDTADDLAELNQHFVYIDDTYANGGGVYVTDDTVSSGEAPTNYYSRITTNGYEIVWDGINVADFSDEVRIGEEDSTRLMLEPYGITGYTKDGACNMVIGQSDLDDDTDSAEYSYFRFGLVDAENVGKHSLALGYGNVASGYCSLAFGSYTEASGSYSHAEGYYTEASDDYSHAEGYRTEASGSCSHAEGYRTEASGYCSHAEGYYTEASGYCSHAEGYYTEASDDYSHAFGKYTDEVEGYAIIVGGGTKTSPTNICTLDWSGNAYFQGDISVKGDISVGGDITGSRYTGTTIYHGSGYIRNSKKYIYFSVPYVSYGETPSAELYSLYVNQDGNDLVGTFSSPETDGWSSASFSYSKAGYFYGHVSYSSSISNAVDNSAVGIYAKITIS